MGIKIEGLRYIVITSCAVLASCILLVSAGSPAPPIRFILQKLPFRLETDETPARHLPSTMAGGVAVFDYNGDGRPDIFFTNGAVLSTLKKSAPKFNNRLYRNDGAGVFTDVTADSGLAGKGYDQGVAVGDFDNDGRPDLFVAGVHRSTLYHNNGDGTFTDVTEKAGFNRASEWAVAAAWVDVNNDGLLDLFVVNYAQWDYATEPVCAYRGLADYCAPSFYKGLPNRLYLNKGGGVFEDVSEKWGVLSHIGKGMGAGIADYDLDGRPDIFVTNDGYYNFLFHNTGSKFEEKAFEAGVALTEDGNFISGMGLDFRDFNNDEYPDAAFAALSKQTFPFFLNLGGREFKEVTTENGMRAQSIGHSGFGAALYDFDNDSWKDLFVTGGHVLSVPKLHETINEHNMVFRNPGATGKWSLVDGAGLDAAIAGRHRGCAFGDFDGDGRIDAVTTALGLDAEVWMNRGGTGAHWMDIALEGTASNRDGIGARVAIATKSGKQFNQNTTSVCYASSSDGPVHFGLGPDTRVDSIEIHWPSGIVQVLRDQAGDRLVHVKEPAR